MDNDLLLTLGNLVDSEGLGEVIEALAECAAERDEFGVQRELDGLALLVHEHVCMTAVPFVPGVDVLLGD